MRRCVFLLHKQKISGCLATRSGRILSLRNIIKGFFAISWAFIIFVVSQDAAWSKKTELEAPPSLEAVAAPKSPKEMFALAASADLREIKAAIEKDETLANARDEEGNTLLMASLKADRDKEINLYLFKVTDIDALNNNGESITTFACRYSSDKKVIKKILTHGNDPMADARTRLLHTDNNGVSAYERAFENPCPIARNLAIFCLRKKDLEHFILLYLLGDDQNAHSKNVNPRSSKISGESKLSMSAPVVPLDDAPPKRTQSAIDEAVPYKPPYPVQSANNPPPSSGMLRSDGAGRTSGKRAPLQDDILAYPLPSYSPRYLYEYAEDDGEEDYNIGITDANERGKNGITPLMLAAKKGNGWEVRALLGRGARVNDSDNDGWTALMYAARYQMDNSIAETLLDAGASVTNQNNYGFTALSIAACYNENPQVIKTIIKKFGAGEDEVFRALICSITAVSSEEVRLAKINVFMDYKVPLNRYWEGKTPLMYAAMSCRKTKVLSVLMDNGAMPSLASPDGKIAYDYAKANNFLPHDEVFWSLNKK